MPQLKPWPGYITERLHLYEELKKESDVLLAKKAANAKPITVELPDGRKVSGKAWVTTPYKLACDIRLALVQWGRATTVTSTADPVINDCVPNGCNELFSFYSPFISIGIVKSSPKCDQNVTFLI